MWGIVATVIGSILALLNALILFSIHRKGASRRAAGDGELARGCGMDEPGDGEAGDDADETDHHQRPGPAKPEILREDSHPPGKIGFALWIHECLQPLRLFALTNWIFSM